MVDVLVPNQHEAAETDQPSAPRVRTDEHTPLAIQSLPTLSIGISGNAVMPEVPVCSGTGALERIVQFAALGHDGAGRPHFVLGLNLSARCRVRLALTALGRGRIAVAALLRGADAQARTDLDELLERIRARGVTIAQVKLEADDGC